MLSIAAHLHAVMKAPSPLCLRALRSLAYQFPSQQCFTVAASRRHYASLPERPPIPSQSRPPPRKAPPPPPPPAASKPTFRATPSGSGLRKRRDDDEDFTPYPLPRPIGMADPPQPGENMGLDKRTLRQRRDDFHDYEKHLQRRAKMTRQIAKPYFRDWSNMRFHKGKVFVANDRLFRSEHALYFPNFFGKTLNRNALKVDTSDGYGGYGRNTCEAMKGKISVVSIVSNTWAEEQVATFCSPKHNPGLHQVLQQNKDIVQRVEINHESNAIKWWLLQLFSGNLRTGKSPDEQGKYFMVRRGVSDIMKEAIGLLNDKGGYVYLVDPECKIRWAGSAEAQETEKESMVGGLRKLVQEVRTPRETRERVAERKAQLEAAVQELTEKDVPKKAAAGV